MKKASNFNSLACIGILFFLLWIGACVPPKGVTPNKVAILDFDGEAVEEIEIAQGMTHKLYTGVYAAALEGDRFLGDASSKKYLDGVAFEVLKDKASDGVLEVSKNGCIRGKKAGTALVRLKAFSLDRGQLESIAQVTVKALNIGKANVLQSAGDQDFSAAPLEQLGKAAYGFTIGPSFNFLDLTAPSIALNSDSGFPVESGSDVTKEFNIISDQSGQGYILSYGREKGNLDDRLSYAVFQRNGERTAIFDSNQKLSIIRTYAFHLQNNFPLAVGLSRVFEDDQETENVRFYAFQNLLDKGANEAFISDARTRGMFEVPVSSAEIVSRDVDRIIQAVQDRSGTGYIATGAFVNIPDQEKPKEKEILNQLKVITFDPRRGTFVDEISQAKLANKKAFAIDASGQGAKIIFVNEQNQMIFIRRLAGVWGAALTRIGDQVNADFSPRLMANDEDGTLAAVWKSDTGSLKVNFSSDGGLKWLKEPVEVALTASDVELISLPCRGAALITKNSGNLNITFVDAAGKSSTPTHQINQASGVKKIRVFRDHGVMRLFFNTSQSLGMVTIP